MVKFTSEDRQTLKVILTPSWISLLGIILAGLIITGGTIITFNLHHSNFGQYLLDWERARTERTAPISQSLQPAKPSLNNSWTLFAVWALVGCLVCLAAAWFVRSIMHAVELEKEMTYVHVDQKAMIENVVEHVTLRIVATFLLLSLALFFIYHLLPDVINLAKSSGGSLISFNGARSALLSFLVTSICAYAANVLLRLIAGRKRLFSA